MDFATLWQTIVPEVTKALSVAIAGAVLILTGKLVAAVNAWAARQRLGIEQQQTTQAVAAAEQVIGPGQGAVKKALVERTLVEKGIEPDSIAIEAAVYGLTCEPTTGRGE